MSTPALVIVWLPKAEQWVVVEWRTRKTVERFTHLADAGWFVQSKERAA